METQYDYDIFVIGGGSAGIAAARLAALAGKKSAVADYVTPSAQGSQWGLGGTCINVGCIPKKLFHISSLYGESLEDIASSGWELDPSKVNHNWEKMVKGVRKYIKGLYWGAKKTLKLNHVTFYNKLARFVDPHTIELYDPNSDKTEKITAQNIVISCGGRPTYPDIPGGKEYGINSDDVFFLKKRPGKTLVVGGSYIALETAGFLHSFKCEVTMIVRSVLLRSFDQGIATKIGNHMEKSGIKIHYKCAVQKIEKLESGQLKVTYTNDNDGSTHVENFDNVFYAIGRTPNTIHLHLEAAGVEIDPKSLKVKTNEKDQSNVPHIYALGDCAHGRPELTPTAVYSGKLLAQRLFQNSQELMDYTYVPTTVFTPIEYGSVGHSQESAYKEFGNDNVTIYHAVFRPFTWVLNENRPKDACYVKMICKKDEDERVVGLHYLGTNAGDIIMGYAVAVKNKLTKKQFDSTVGIHPTDAEDVLSLAYTIDQDPKVSESCAGCGF